MAKKLTELKRTDGTRGSDAFALMQLIARVEGRSFDCGAQNAVDREWILETYRQCRAVALGKASPAVYLNLYSGTPSEHPT
jgi:hypothetical protein